MLNIVYTNEYTCLFFAIPISTFNENCIFDRVDDSGSFTCIAENDAGRASIVIDLVVQGK